MVTIWFPFETSPKRVLKTNTNPFLALNIWNSVWEVRKSASKGKLWALRIETGPIGKPQIGLEPRDKP